MLSENYYVLILQDLGHIINDQREWLVTLIVNRILDVVFLIGCYHEQEVTFSTIEFRGITSSIVVVLYIIAPWFHKINFISCSSFSSGGTKAHSVEFMIGVFRRWIFIQNKNK